MGGAGGGGASGQNLEHLQKGVFLCWSFLEVYIFATIYRIAFIVGPKVPFPTQPYPTPPHPTQPTPRHPTLTIPIPTLPYPYPLPSPTLTLTLTLPYPTLPYPIVGIRHRLTYAVAQKTMGSNNILRIRTRRQPLPFYHFIIMLLLISIKIAI